VVRILNKLNKRDFYLFLSILFFVLPFAILKFLLKIDIEEVVHFSKITVSESFNESDNEENAKDVIDLEILTYNIRGISYPVTNNLSKRLEFIVKEIEKYDIVGIQEAFSHKTDLLLENRYLPYYIRYDNRSLLSFGSGLMLLSKYKIVEYDFKEFSMCKEADCFAKKGVLFTRIFFPEIGEVDIYNTHYQAESENGEIRKGQNREFYEIYKQKDKGNLTILLGDFNFRRDSPEYIDFITLFNPVDTFAIVHPREEGITHEGARIDYIFLLGYGEISGFDIQILDSDVVLDSKVQGQHLSDHFGVLTILRLRSIN